MISELSKTEVQEFLRLHGQDDPARVALMKNLPAGISPTELASQLKARKKAKDKLPSWYARDGIIFPHGVAMEQCSSEETARFKVRNLTGDSFLDLTGGTGVDSWALSQVFAKGVLVEPDEERSQLAAHNLACLDTRNISVVRSTAEEFLRLNRGVYDLIYLDPDRRANRKRTSGLNDSTPDVVQLMPDLLQKGRLVLIKASPMLDIQLAIQQLQKVKQVTVLAVNNEVKELLFYCTATASNAVEILAVNIAKDGEQLFSFLPDDEKAAEINLSEPLQYLYEPNAAILKAGAFKSVAARFSLNKLHRNSHLYTSTNFVSDFPGRVFKISDVKPYTSKLQKSAPFSFSKAHVATRNFPLSADELQKRLKLQEGAETYIFGTTTSAERLVIVIAHRLR